MVIIGPVKSDFVNVQIFAIVLDCSGVAVLGHLFSNKNVFFQHKICLVLCAKIVPLFMLVMLWEGGVHVCQLPAEPRREHWIPSS